MKILLAALALAAVGCSEQKAETTSSAQTIELTGRVVDRANLIDAATEQTLVSRLAALEARTSDQLVVVTVPTLHGQPIEKFALEFGKRWGVGRADLDNGVLLLVAPNERRARVEVGLGLEGLLTDAEAARVIRLMRTEFREGNMQEGISTGVAAIDQLLSSDVRRPQPRPQTSRAAA